MERACGEWQTDFWAALDGELPATESSALAVHLRECAGCREAIAEAVATHRSLLEAADRKSQFVLSEATKLELKEIHGDGAGPLPEEAGNQPAPVAEIHAVEKQERVRPRVIFVDWRVLASAAVIVLTLLAFATREYWRVQSGPSIDIDMSPMAPVATVESVSGNVAVINEDYSSHKAAKAKQFLTAKEGLEIKGAGKATLRMRDGTILTLTPESGTCRFWAHPWNGSQPGPVRMVAGVQVSLEHGVMDANVVRQAANSPMTIATVQAEAKIIGTVFRLTAADKTTRLDVREGLVQLTRRADQKSVQVAANEFCVVEVNGKMVVKQGQ